MQLSPGVRVRSFEVLGPVGAGGMGAVYRARDTRLGREVAIKILQDDVSKSREYLHRFEREARAASALNHPNIITIFEIGDHGGLPFIAMELVDGLSLRETLKKGPIPLRRLLDIAAQVADGLAAAHECGIVHRDLKPENVMLTKEGRVKILDFGLARVNHPVSAADSTSEFSSIRTPEGRILGTAAYVSPEQASGGRQIDYRSDQFSFGSLLYELATGRRAFERGSTIETLAAIMRDEPEPVQRRNPRIPAPLVWIIDRCLAKDPAARYRSTRDLAEEVRTLRDRLPETSPGRLAMPSRWSRSVRSIAVSIVALAVVLAAIAFSGRMKAQQLPHEKYLAVLPFADLSGRADALLFSQGFSEAVSSRLSRYSGVQVIPPSSSAALVAKKATFKRVAEEVGATLLLNASLQRLGDELRVSYSIIDPARGSNVAGDDVTGSAGNLWSIQDEVADGVARQLGIVERKQPTPHAGLETPREQDLYVRALGALDHPDDQKSIDTAINFLDELTQTNADSSLVQAALARALRARYLITNEKNSIEGAIRASERARRLDPDSADVLMTVGAVKIATGDYEGAVESFRKAVARQPASAEAMVGLGSSLQKKHDDTAAEIAYRRAIELLPTWWVPHNEAGLLYSEEQRLADAEREFRAVIKLNPSNGWGYMNLGVVQIKRGRLRDATVVLERAAALGQPGAYSNLGYCYYFLGDFDRAAAFYRKAVELAPTVAVRWANLADACTWSTQCRGEVTADYQKAIELLRRDLFVNPKSARTHGTLAVCLAKTGRTAEAIQHMKIALELDPANSARMYQAARVSQANGRQQEAVAWLEKAVAAGYQMSELEHDPEFGELRSSAVYRNRFVKSGSPT